MAEYPVCSPAMRRYFDELSAGVKRAYAIAAEARAKGYDPARSVEVALAENLAERVIGLISVVAPQLQQSGMADRILELEVEFGKLDWRVALTIALEVAQQKHCRFSTALEAIEIGIRVGFAYVTNGVVSAPLEGFTKLELKRRLDGKGEYFSLYYSGPVRNAGGTAAAVSVLIADYIRKKLGYAEYDPTEAEVRRCGVELEDYHNFITNLQYFPSIQETTYLMEHLPIEIAGEESEKYEVSNVNVKDLPRIKENKLRNGYCLIHSSCIPLKAPKLWAKLEKWGGAFDLGHWSFLKEFVALQKRMKAKGKKTGGDKIKPDYTYIKDLVAGRPVFAHPLRPGGWRLRYGRSRASGYSGQAINPASMIVLQGFLATGTQLKTERPGKAAAFTPCDTIDGPIVKLRDGSVHRLNTEQAARDVATEVEEILYLGDVLINYGDFFDRAHPLIPAGYVEEQWAVELEAIISQKDGLPDVKDLSKRTGIHHDRLQLFLGAPLTNKPTFAEAIAISRAVNVPLHPKHTLFWSLLTIEELAMLRAALLGQSTEKLVLPLELKRTLETLGVEHRLATENIIVTGDAVGQLCILTEREASRTEDSLGYVNACANVAVRDKAGLFIGSRMGRPEKAKMRKMTGSPHMLFPVGEEGGRLRSVQAALEAGKIVGSFPKGYFTDDEHEVRFRCDGFSGSAVLKEQDAGEASIQTIDIKSIFAACLRHIGSNIYPDLIKGVRGTSNNEHIPEHLVKGILRAKHGVYVNKDGTVRYDASEITLTHFKPKEVQTSVERLVQLGYDRDVNGEPLRNENQVLELKAQDVVLPCCEENPEEPADLVFMNVARFVDDELTKLYRVAPFFNLQSPRDLVGHLIVGLAPHTSAGTLGRIIGFSRTQGFLAHPYFHAAMRRDCDGDESCFVLLLDALLNFSRKYLPESRGSTMDAPLVLTSILTPSEVDDMAFHVDIPWRYPIELYTAAAAYKNPWEVSIPQIKEVLETEAQFEGMGYTHETSDINAGVRCSAYKLLPSMEEKMRGQMLLAERIRACDASDVARLVIEKHFIRDTKGNLRKFSQQQYRCVQCNAKYRRPPLRGNCRACGGKIIFTISEGSVVKYLEPSISLATRFNVPTYLKQDLELTKRRIEAVFGRDAEIQQGLGQWF